MSYFYYFVGIEVEAYYCVVAFGVLGFFFYGEAVAFFVEFCYSVTFWIIYPVAEDCGFLFFFSGFYCVFEDF